MVGRREVLTILEAMLFVLARIRTNIILLVLY